MIRHVGVGGALVVASLLVAAMLLMQEQPETDADDGLYRDTTYLVDDTSWIRNPHRGYRGSWDSGYRSAADTHSAAWWLAQVRDRYDSAQIVFGWVQLDSFQHTWDIPESYLRGIEYNLKEVRKAGLDYEFSMEYYGSPKSAEPAPPNSTPHIDTMCHHVSQLATVINKYREIVTLWNASAIGRWGEWGSEPVNYSLDTLAQRKLIDTILARVDSTIPVTLRCPRYKRWYLRIARMTGGGDPTDTTRAGRADRYGAAQINDVATGKAIVRLGIDEGAAVRNQDNSGTYIDVNLEYPQGEGNPSDTSYLRPYHEWDSRYSWTSGEANWISGDTAGTRGKPAGRWCGNNPDHWIDSTRIVNEFARNHWSVFGKINDPYNAWDSCGCGGRDFMPYGTKGAAKVIERRLGYRYSLIRSTLPRIAYKGRTLRVRFHVLNKGFAALWKPRGLEFLLKSGTGNTHSWNLMIPGHRQLDPRFWWPGDTISIDTSIVVPDTLGDGDYSAFLALPDTSMRRQDGIVMHDDPKYSVRLANGGGIWDGKTGYHDLLQSIAIRRKEVVRDTTEADGKEN